jgi:hypothetical protein
MLSLAALAANAENPAKIQCKRGKADFALTADPDSPHWKGVKPVAAAVDPFGKPAGANAFEFRTQWTKDNLYFLFSCPYASLNLKPNPSTTEETNQLWNWDVTEVFIGSNFDAIDQYKELQVSPRGEWVDLDINRKNPRPDGGWKWNSGMTVKGRIDEGKKIWYGEMKIPLKSLDERPAKAGNEMRINIYRLSGDAGQRISTMWVQTDSRSHHTPETFGRIALTK